MVTTKWSDSGQLSIIQGRVYSLRMALSDIELRVLGALIEKERTTPEGYPLSSQALATACNQRTNREPVTDYHLQDVMTAVGRLRDRGLAETVQGPADRVAKHRHKAATAFGLSDAEVAVLAVLLLRGPQTPGELRSRTERYVAFGSVDAVVSVLEQLSSRSPPLTKRLGRGPGQSQDRYTHTLGVDEGHLSPRLRRAGEGNGRERLAPAGSRAVPGAGDGEGQDAISRVHELEAQVAKLEAQVSRLAARVTELEDRGG